jgi:hypothetical protein
MFEGNRRKSRHDLFGHSYNNDAKGDIDGISEELDVFYRSIEENYKDMLNENYEKFGEAREWHGKVLLKDCVHSETNKGNRFIEKSTKGESE